MLFWDSCRLILFIINDDDNWKDEKYEETLRTRRKPLINYLFMFHTPENVDNNRLSIFLQPLNHQWTFFMQAKQLQCQKSHVTVKNEGIVREDSSSDSSMNFESNIFVDFVRNLK